MRKRCTLTPSPGDGQSLDSESPEIFRVRGDLGKWTPLSPEMDRFLRKSTLLIRSVSISQAISDPRSTVMLVLKSKKEKPFITFHIKLEDQQKWHLIVRDPGLELVSFSALVRSNRVNPRDLQILLQVWEWKNSAMPLVPRLPSPYSVPKSKN